MLAAALRAPAMPPAVAAAGALAADAGGCDVTGLARAVLGAACGAACPLGGGLAGRAAGSGAGLGTAPRICASACSEYRTLSALGAFLTTGASSGLAGISGGESTARATTAPSSSAGSFQPGGGRTRNCWSTRIMFASVRPFHAATSL
jgi:hypothetical protein